MSNNLKVAQSVIQHLAVQYGISQGFLNDKGEPVKMFMGGAVIYISGPMSKYPNFNRESFWLAEMALNIAGHATLSPAHWESDQDYEVYMRADFQMVLKANTVFALKGWQDSKGAIAEVTMAKSLNYTIFEET